MGERTGIVYARHTFSPWWGCTKVSPGCAHCYAEITGARRGVKWGNGEKRMPVSEATWKMPARWARAAAKAGERRRVLVSMCDWLDEYAPREWYTRFCDLVRETAYALDWMLLTKRSERLQRVSADVLEAAWVGVTVEDADHAYRLDDLCDVPARVRFISCEPLLSLPNLRRPCAGCPECGSEDRPGGHIPNGIDLVIAGGESGKGWRPLDIDWLRAIRRDCDRAGVAFYLKQLAGYNPTSLPELDGRCHDAMPQVRA